MMSGKAIKFGDHIDTDQIIPARYLVTTDEKELGAHCMEGADPTFVNRVNPGDIMIGGVNFGCGSSREHAPVSLRGAGITCVVARSFARIFFRNSINLGLPVLESPEAVDGISEGDEVEVDLERGIIRNLTTEQVFQAKPYEPFMMELIQAGGLIEYTKRKLAAQNA
jgi:3-isopropylmalate/(R)-2-methylmalate dehydratase small subunit